MAFGEHISRLDLRAAAAKQDALSSDAQFSTVDAQQLVELIKATGRRLTTIYISDGDPDFYAAGARCRGGGCGRSV